MFYKNVSYSAKTFHGVTFQPGEIKEVSEYINDVFMVRVKDSQVKCMQQKLSSDKFKKDAPKVEEPLVVASDSEPAKEEDSESLKDNTKSSNKGHK